MRLSGYDTFRLYLALKNHFTVDKYDFFKYNAKINISKEAYVARKDRFQFERLSRKCDNIRDHLLANFLKDKTWVGEMLDDDAFDNTTEYIKINQSMSETFKNDLKNIGDVRSSILSKDGQYPSIITLLLSGKITYQTFVILDYFIKLLSKFDGKFPNDFIWSKLSRKIKKFAPFILSEIDKKKLAKILKEHIYT